MVEQHTDHLKRVETYYDKDGRLRQDTYIYSSTLAMEEDQWTMVHWDWPETAPLTFSEEKEELKNSIISLLKIRSGVAQFVSRPPGTNKN